MLKHKDRTLRSPDPLARRLSFCVHQFAAFCPSDHWNSEAIPCLEVEVFDVSHNPELGGIIPEQIIVDWAEARPQKCSCYLPELGHFFWPFGSKIPGPRQWTIWQFWTQQLQDTFRVSAMSSVELEGKRKSEDIPIFPYISIIPIFCLW